MGLNCNGNKPTAERMGYPALENTPNLEYRWCHFPVGLNKYHTYPKNTKSNSQRHARTPSENSINAICPTIIKIPNSAIKASAILPMDILSAERITAGMTNKPAAVYVFELPETSAARNIN